MGVVLWTMPFDFIWCVRRVVRSLHPSLFVLVETDLWPGLLYYLRNRGVTSVLVNGRVSPRTLHGYKRTPWVTRWIFKPLGLCLMQTGLDASRLMQLDLGRVTRIRTAGNLKFDRSWAPMEDGERHSWQKDLGLDAGSEVWVAGSVHGGEEKVLVGAYHRLKISFPRLRLIIAPRRIEDAHGIRKYTTAHGWRVALKSELKGDGKQWDILVLDSLGELGRIYGLGALAFVGGSLVPVGGHNLLEPASFGCPVLFGPHTHNFQEMAEGLVDFGGGIRVSNETELCDSITMLLSDPERGVAMGRLAKGFVLKNQGALDRVMEANSGHCFPSKRKRVSMTAFRVKWHEIHRNRGFGAWPLCLGAFSFFYGVGVYLRHRAYEMGWLRGRVLPGFVLSVGNLTVGGTGKTPAVVMLAKWARREGFRVAVLSRGYGGRFREWRPGSIRWKRGQDLRHRSAGMSLFYWPPTFPGYPSSSAGTDMRQGWLPIDDLDRIFLFWTTDFNIFPSGGIWISYSWMLKTLSETATSCRWVPLREPLRHLRRADVIIYTRAKEGGANNETLNVLETHCPRRPVFFAVHEPEEVVFPALGQSHGPGILKGKRVAAFAAIANPLSFKETLSLLGAEIIYFKGFPDHHAFSRGEIETLVQAALARQSEYLLTTEKDWVRILNFIPDRLPTGYLRIRFSLAAHQERFFQIIRDGIKAKQDS